MRRIAWVFPVWLMLTASAYADYGWIPERHKFNLRGGLDVMNTVNNFDVDGATQGFTLSGAPVKVKDVTFWVHGEYGVVENLSVWTKLQFLDTTADKISDGGLLASATGFGDSFVGFKYALNDSYPLYTAETYFKFPTGSTSAPTIQDMVLGEGNMDWGLRGHLGHKLGELFLLSVSPGFLMRFGGYTPALTLEGAGQINFSIGYARLFFDGMFSLGQNALSPSTITNHNLAGAAGSYSKLAASPNLLSIGLKAGLQVFPNVSWEVMIAGSILGVRAPQYFKFGTNVVINFDFYKPDFRPKIKDVPFEAS